MLGIGAVHDSDGIAGLEAADAICRAGEFTIPARDYDLALGIDQTNLDK